MDQLEFYKNFKQIYDFQLQFFLIETVISNFKHNKTVISFT